MSLVSCCDVLPTRRFASPRTSRLTYPVAPRQYRPLIATSGYVVGRTTTASTAQKALRLILLIETLEHVIGNIIGCIQRYLRIEDYRKALLLRATSAIAARTDTVQAERSNFIVFSLKRCAVCILQTLQHLLAVLLFLGKN